MHITQSNFRFARYIWSKDLAAETIVSSFFTLHSFFTCTLNAKVFAFRVVDVKTNDRRNAYQLQMPHLH